MDYLSIVLFTLTTCITPGPNNVMLMSSGVNFGISRTMRHVVGINIGFPLMLTMVGLGLGTTFHNYPKIYIVLHVISIVYLVYLAYGIATSAVFDQNDKSGSPCGVMKAAFFQWVNPKAWVMSLTAILVYANPEKLYLVQVLSIALIFFIFGIPCSLVWVFFGKFIRRLFKYPRTLRIFNITMALLLIVSLLPEVFEFINLTIE